MLRLRKRLTYANVMSSIAVFVVLGGAAYAAATLPKNSVGSEQIKANAVTSSKVKDGSLLSKDFKPGQLVAGAPGPVGQAGPAGPAGPAGAGAAGAKGDKGDPGRSALTPLRAGESESGVFGLGSQASAAAQQFLDFRSFSIPLSAPLDSAHVVSVTTASASNCPGAGQAAAGYLCVYQAMASNAAGGGIYTEAGGPGASVRGFVVRADSLGVGGMWFGGTYTVTGS